MSEEKKEEFAVSYRDLKALYSNLIPQVEKDLKGSAIAASLPRPSCPEGIEDICNLSEEGAPTMPGDITTLHIDDIGKLHWYMANWASYTQEVVQNAKCRLLVAKRELKVVQSALEIIYRELEDIPIGQISNYIVTDRRFVQEDLEVLRWDIFVKKAEARFEAYRRARDVASREQSRRGDDLKGVLIGDGDRMAGIKRPKRRNTVSLRDRTRKI